MASADAGKARQGGERQEETATWLRGEMTKWRGIVQEIKIEMN